MSIDIVLWQPYILKNGNTQGNRPDVGKTCRWIVSETGVNGLKELTDKVSPNGLPETCSQNMTVRAWRYLD